MNFSTLSDSHKNWLDILVIGKTIERDGRKYHIVGMTLSDEVNCTSSSHTISGNP